MTPSWLTGVWARQAEQGEGNAEPQTAQPSAALFVLAMPLPSHFQVVWLRDGECRSGV